MTKIVKSTLCCLGMLTAMALTGCQSYLGGQTLPSPYYIKDDVQFHSYGSEMKLAREAAALKEARAQEQAQRNP